MTSQSKRRWLPRFGLRSLFVLVLVVAAYFGSWPWVEKMAQRDVFEAIERDIKITTPFLADPFNEPTSVSPYVLVANEMHIERRTSRRRYYVWLFGWTVRLPITTPIPDELSPTFNDSGFGGDTGGGGFNGAF